MAFDVNGSTQYFDIPIAPLKTYPLTMSGWYRYDTAIVNGSELTVLDLTQKASTNEITIEIGNDTTADFAIAAINDNNIHVGFAQIGTPAINTWQHLVGLFPDANSRTVWLDASKTATEATVGTPTGIDHLTTGATWSANALIKFFNGALAELAIWNAILTLKEVTMLAKGMSAAMIRPQSLIFYRPFIKDNVGVDMLRSQPYISVANPGPFGHPRILRPIAGLSSGMC